MKSKKYYLFLLIPSLLFVTSCQDNLPLLSSEDSTSSSIINNSTSISSPSTSSPLITTPPLSSSSETTDKPKNPFDPSKPVVNKYDVILDSSKPKNDQLSYDIPNYSCHGAPYFIPESYLDMNGRYNDFEHVSAYIVCSSVTSPLPKNYTTAKKNIPTGMTSGNNFHGNKEGHLPGSRTYMEADYGYYAPAQRGMKRIVSTYSKKVPLTYYSESHYASYRQFLGFDGNFMLWSPIIN